MKVLVATNETQGATAGDYHWAVDGELVTAVTLQCASADRCGCGRGFPGLASDRATTTAMVVDLPHVDLAALRTAVRDGLERQGWLHGLTEPERHGSVEDHVTVIQTLCLHFPAGTVLRRDGTRVWSSGALAA